MASDKGSVVFSDVVMRYRPDLDPVLRIVSFTILPKEKVGIVGRTGAGKSSLAFALFRLVELGDGHIYVDNEDISKLHLNAIRSKISTITQEQVLFSETISLVLPDSELDRRVSLTGYTNIVLDKSNPDATNSEDEENTKVRVRFAEMPSTGLGLNGLDKPIKRKYSEALQILKPFRPSSKDGTLPVNKVGFFSYAFITWFSPLVSSMYKKRHLPVEESDIWQCSEEEGLRMNTERITRLWNDEVRKKGQEKASFKRVWINFILTRTLVALVLVGINAIATFLSSAFLLNWIVLYMESDEENVMYGLGLSAAMLVCEVTRALTYADVAVFSSQTGTRFRGGYMGLMYHKLLNLRAVKGRVNSEILNVFSVDSYRIYLATFTAPYLLVLPLYIGIATVYSYYLIGYWCFVGLGTFLVMYVAQIYLTSLLKVIRKSTSQYTDARVRRMTEVVNNIKFIKMYSWENPFTIAIKAARKFERKYHLYAALVDSASQATISTSPTISSIASITAYTAAGYSLTPSTAFAVIGTMDFLRIIVALLPMALRAYGEATVSFNRIQKLLIMEEHIIPPNDVFDNDNAVEIKAANLIWEAVPAALPETTDAKKQASKNGLGSRRESINLFTLMDLNLEVKKGQLLGICGSVGSGKSSLVSAILGRMILTKGHLAVDGSVAYVAQQACIFNASVKENILFGGEYQAERYRHTIESCGLEPDLKLLANGDETEIGERGANLSGGQKQRVNLARAVYSDRDIFLLDDPLSALDVRVSKEIFHKCIQGRLKGKTVILVTHQLQYLKHCDEVVVMDNAGFVEKGVHEELLANNGIYTDMFRVFDKTTMKATTKGGSGDGEPGRYAKKPSSPVQAATYNPSVTVANGKPSTTKNKTRKGKLITTEEVATGEISIKAYSTYINAVGGWCLALFGCLLYFLSACALIFSDVWLSLWINTLSNEQEPGINSTMYNNTTTPDINSTMYNNTTTETTNTTISPHTYTSSTIYDTYFFVYVSSLGALLVSTLVSGFGLAKVCINASNRFHDGILDKIMKAPMSFFDSNPAGRILNRFSKDLDEADVYMPMILNMGLRIGMMFIISTAVAAYVTPWLLIGIVPLIIVFYIMKQISSVTIRQIKRLENVARSPLIGHVNTTSQGLPTIVAYEQQERFFTSCSSFGDVSSLMVFLFETSMRWIGLRLDLAASLVSVCASLIFVLSKGSIAPAAAGLVLGLCGKTMRVVQFLLRVTNEFQGRFISIERLHEYQTQIVSESQTAVKMASDKWPDKGSVVFSDVVMRYRPDLDPVLRTVSFTIRPKEKVGIVGRTGAGKSSLAAALFRLVELGDGHIYVDNEDISKLHLHAIRSKISTITQEPVLFSETIRYNVDPFSTYTDDQVWSSLESVHMKQKIEEQDGGLEAMVDENGENYSVGERQLLCLARALLRSSKILLLDEATANIDTSTDALIQQTIRECFADCTVITIAHRLNTVLHSDKIIVLDSGKVMECASPQDLLSNPHSFFNAMIAAQIVKTPSPLPQ